LPYFDQIELAAHIEFVLFLFTLAGIPVLVRALVPGTRAYAAWPALFLFPGVFLYDSTLGINADHIAAFWAVPVWIAMRRALDELDPRRAALFAAMLSGAMLTKYQAAEIVAGPVLVSAARVGWLSVRAARGERPTAANLWRAPLIAVVTAAVLFAPHWLKNWVFYGDPVYPSLFRVLHDHPWTLDSPHRVDQQLANMWRPTGTLAEKLRQTLVNGVVLFSFVPNDSPGFHGTVPVFGSLFSLLTLSLPFLKKSGKAAVLFACSYLGVAIWYWMHHQDRTLQVVVPWMAAGVAAALILIWRSGILGRVAVVPLVATQIVWGGDVYFFPTHAMLNESPIKATVDLFYSFYRNDPRRFTPFGAWYDIGSILPKGAKVLIHNAHIRLGLRAMTVSDWEWWQGGISYGRLGSAGAMYDFLNGIAVTHVLLSPGIDLATLADDLVFWQFAKLYAIEPRSFGGLTLLKMPPSRPKGPFDDRVVVCAPGSKRGYVDGVYRLSDLAPADDLPVPTPSPETPLIATMSRDLPKTEFVVYRSGCDKFPQSTLFASYQLVGSHDDLQLWARPPGR
jgi:hypothetical protein